MILYNVVRPYEVDVAKATIQTKNPRAIVGVLLLVCSSVKWLLTMCL